MIDSGVNGQGLRIESCKREKQRSRCTASRHLGDESGVLGGLDTLLKCREYRGRVSTKGSGDVEPKAGEYLATNDTSSIGG